jgi:hypothetical protein
MFFGDFFENKYKEKSMKTIQVIVGFCLLTVSCIVSAAMPLPMGWYIDAGAGKSKFQNKVYPGSVQYTGFGWLTEMGYKLNPYAAIEAHYIQYGDLKVTSSRSQVARDHHYSYGVALKGIMPLGLTGLQIFTKAGFGKMKSVVSVNNVQIANANGWVFDTHTHYSRGIFYAAGGDLALTPNLGLTAQVVRQKGSAVTGNATLYSLGLSYLI